MIYLDNQATTPTDPSVLRAMLPYFTQTYGNPHSGEHIYGWQAYEAVEKARLALADLIGAGKTNIVFTSGATESVSLAVLGLADLASNRGRRKIITVATEHSCVLESCGRMRGLGYEVVVLPVGSDGLIDLGLLKDHVDAKTLLVSVMLANNEIGVIQPLKAIASICRESGSLCHTDATQAVGKIPLDVEALGIDMLSASAHKIYGPKGVGMLYLTKRAEKKLRPLAYGGGQEKGLRPGTVPVPLAVGFGAAAKIAKRQMKSEAERIRRLRDLFLGKLRETIPDLTVLGSMEKRLPGNLSLIFPGVSGHNVIAALGDRLAVSSGSSCSSSSSKPSHVVKALGFGDDVAQAALRVGIGRFNTNEEITRAAGWMASAAGRH